VPRGASVSNIGGSYRTTTVLDGFPDFSSSFVHREAPTTTPELTSEQEAHAQIVAEKVLQIARETILEMTRLAAS
jgi:hypothetical protein